MAQANLKTVRIAMSPHGGNPTASPAIRRMEEIRRHLATLDYPIASHEALSKMVKPGHRYFVEGREIRPSVVIPQIPAEFFPIKSAEDFETKIAGEFQRRAESVHPSSLNAPRANQKPSKARG
jgi:hypothetical protein